MTYKRDPRTLIGEIDYASAAGNPPDLTNVVAGAANNFLMSPGTPGVPQWRTSTVATNYINLVTQLIKGLINYTLFNRLSTELINYVSNSNFQADTPASACANWTATNAIQICSSTVFIIGNRSMRIAPNATLTGTVDGNLSSFDDWVLSGGTSKTLSVTFSSYGDPNYLDNEMEFVIWDSTDSVEVANTTSTIPFLAKYHKVSWVPVSGKTYVLRFKTTAVAITHRIFVDDFVCKFEQERAANTFLLGPVSGADTVSTYRTIAAEDIATGTPTAGTIPVSAGAGVKPVWQSLTTTASTTSYTPVLTASAGTAPTNYASTGYWFTVADQCFVEAEVTFIGSGNASDAGIFRISLPNSFTAAATAACIGKGEIIDTSTGFRYNATVRAVSGEAFVTVSVTDENADLSYLVPVTLVNTDVIKIQFNFQATQLVSAQVIDTTLFTPRGTMVMYIGDEASQPAGWLLCDGRSISQTTYAALYAVVGANKYGTDSGGNFFLPDLRASTPVGVNNATLPNGARGAGYSTRNRSGAALGAETVASNVAISDHSSLSAYVPAHGHAASSITVLDDSSHTHATASGAGPLYIAGGANYNPLVAGTGLTAANISGLTTGTGSAHNHGLQGNAGPNANGDGNLTINWNTNISSHSVTNNLTSVMQPSTVVNFIVKY